MTTRAPHLLEATEQDVRIPVRQTTLPGLLTLPAEPRGLVLFVHGSGSSRHSPRNKRVAGRLLESGQATLLVDLLTRDEEAEDADTGFFRFDLPLLADRLAHAAHWALAQPWAAGLGLGCFGASTGAGAALMAAAEDPRIAAIVSRGGRPDLAGDALPKVKAPTLLIVGGLDEHVLMLNRRALARLTCPCELKVVPCASHLFEEPGALEEVAELAAAWFGKHLEGRGGRP
jgi:dienelactone hydrolase